jgi:hypothetical protein
MTQPSVSDTPLSLAILICSCDAYADVWDPFFTLFFRHWPDCPWPIYLIANHRRYPDERVNTLLLGDDKDWSTTFCDALERIPEDIALVLMEDYLLLAPPRTNEIARLARIMTETGAAHLRIFPCPGPDLPFPGYEDLGILKKGAPYRTSLQAALWDRKALLNLAKRGENAWEFEHNATRRSNDMDALFLSLQHTPTDQMEDYPFPYLCTGVVKRKWIREAVEYCKKEGVALDLKTRPMESNSVRYLRLHPLANRIFEICKKITHRIKRLFC